MNNTTDLTKGPITGRLITLALPLIATNFIQTAYNFIDMIWIGRLGNEAVIAVGSAGFFINLGMALFALVVTGTGIRVSQKFGARAYGEMRQYIGNAFVLAGLLALVYGGGILIFRDTLIGFLNLKEAALEERASRYLGISACSTFIMVFNMVFSNVLTSLGNSRLSFRINAIGFVLNILLDPLFIFGVGGYLQFGLYGAAYATIISRTLVLILSLIKSIRMIPRGQFHFRFSGKEARDVLTLGTPFTIQRVAFTLISIVVARLIARWGAEGIAVQKIGLQVEALSYMTIGGLYGAVIGFIGQNHGAGDRERVVKGYNTALLLSLGFGLFTGFLFLVFPRSIFQIFLSDPALVSGGVSYLRIIGVSQAFMCMEIVTMASFNGLGKTRIPPAVSLSFTTLRIPLILILERYTDLGVNAVWWAVSLTSIMKGILLVSLFRLYLGSQYKSVNQQEALNV